jgi:hypothetical protein
MLKRRLPRDTFSELLRGELISGAGGKRGAQKRKTNVKESG